MDYYLSYIFGVFQTVKSGLYLGTFVYLIIFFTLFATQKSRRNLKLKYLAEWLFCLYFGAILSITGMLSIGLNSFRLTGLRYNLVPLVDGVFHPMVLNFILFIPFGLLVPLALYNHKSGGRGKSATKHGWRWYHAFMFGLVVSLVIEIIQLFFGRYAEIDDVIMNGLGTLAGYALCASLLQMRKNPGKGFGWLGILVLCILAGYMGLHYLVLGTLF